MSILVRLRSFLIPASIGLMVVVAAVSYNLFFLPAQRRYLDDRNFRVLKNLSEQIRLSIHAFDKMMDNAADSGITNEMLKAYLKNVAPSLEKAEESESKRLIGEDYGDPPKMAVSVDGGNHFLYLAFRRGSQVRYAIRTNLDRLIDRLSPPTRRCPFDVLALAQSDGTVIYQNSLSGVVLAHVNTLEDASGEKKQEKSSALITLDTLSQSNTLEQVKIAGVLYRLYSQPLQLPFTLADPIVKKNSGSSASTISKPWVLYGLIRDDRFRAESQAIPSAYVLWLSAVILLAVAAYPFIKLHVSSPAERFRAYDVGTIAVSVCFAAAVLTFIILDLVCWQERLDRSAEDQMSRIASAIDSNFEKEKNKAFDQLQSFFEKDSTNVSDLRSALHRAEADISLTKGDRHPKLTSDRAGCNPSWACRTEIRSDPTVARLLDNYPYLLYVNWSDFSGRQRVKWTTRKSITPFLKLNDPSISYYQAMDRAFRYSADIGAVPTEGIGTQYSPNTGDNITVFWKLFDIDGNSIGVDNATKDKRKWFCASLVTKPISVFDPILPDGFQFAVVRPDGLVVFHSDHSRNLRENFFSETDQDQKLLSRVSMRAEGPLVVNYMGRPHRLYVHPMGTNKDELWTVVVFRDLHAEQTMNLEVLSLASILFLLYATVIAATLILLHRTGESRSWLWPDSRKARRYRLLIIVNVVSGVVFVLALRLTSPVTVLVCGISIPVAVMVFNVAMLKREADRRNTADENEGASTQWQRVYVGACVTLIVVVSVLPCLSCFKLACNFEQKLFVEGMQLRLAADIEDRAECIRTRYQNFQMGRYAGRLLAPPEEETAPYFSYHRVLDTTVHSGENYETPRNSDLCGMGSAVRQRRCVELLLSWITPPYNQLAVDNRYLAEAGSSDMWAWFSTLSMGQQKLVLTKREHGNKVLTVASPWVPLEIPWTSWRWWMSITVFILALVAFIRLTARRMFLLDLITPGVDKELFVEGDPKMCQGLFSRRSKEQKLLLVQLAQEGLVNPNSRRIVRELMKEGLIERKHGLLAIKCGCFADFLKEAVSSDVVKRWERQEAGIRSASLRTSLLILGIGVAGFLVYSQGEVLNTWVTYMTGIVALVPALLRLLDTMRHGGGKEG